jgi:hypothetical protein
MVEHDIHLIENSRIEEKSLKENGAIPWRKKLSPRVTLLVKLYFLIKHKIFFCK